jgi:hypothetical protein
MGWATIWAIFHTLIWSPWTANTTLEVLMGSKRRHFSIPAEIGTPEKAKKVVKKFVPLIHFVQFFFARRGSQGFQMVYLRAKNLNFGKFL